jgi:hypothetical protein
MASDNGDESAGTEQAVFGRNEWSLGRRISGASADSLVVEKRNSIKRALLRLEVTFTSFQENVIQPYAGLRREHHF